VRGERLGGGVGWDWGEVSGVGKRLGTQHGNGIIHFEASDDAKSGLSRREAGSGTAAGNAEKGGGGA